MDSRFANIPRLPPSLLQSLCSDLQTFMFLLVPAATMSSNADQTLFNPPPRNNPAPEAPDGDEAAAAAPGQAEAPLKVAEGGQDATGDEVASTDAPHAPAAAEEGGGADEDVDGDSATAPDALPMRGPSEVVPTTLSFLNSFLCLNRSKKIGTLLLLLRYKFLLDADEKHACDGCWLRGPNERK